MVSYEVAMNQISVPPVPSLHRDMNRTLYVSPSYEQTWGRPQSLFQNPLNLLEAVHPDDRQELLESLETQKPRKITENLYRIVQPDRSIHWIRDSASHKG